MAGPSQPLCWFSTGGSCCPEPLTTTSLPAPSLPGQLPHPLGSLLGPSARGWRLSPRPRATPSPGPRCSRTALSQASGTGCLSPSAPQAPVTVDASVRGMLKVLSSLSEKDTGTFLDWEGKVVPW